MRRVFLFLESIIFFLILIDCNKSDSHLLEGTWKLQSGIYIDHEENQEIKTANMNRFCMKVMSPTHFAVVEMFKDKPDSLFFVAVGTYELTKDKYIETYEASNVEYQVGTSREFTYSLDADHWTVDRTREDMKLNELWIREHSSGTN